MWVTSYRLWYYDPQSNEQSGVYYKENNSESPGHLFDGNSDSDALVVQELRVPIFASKIRFYPVSWKAGIGMRAKCVL